MTELIHAGWDGFLFDTLMWTGALIMVLGAGISLTDRRYRIGAPSKRPARQEAEPEAGAGAKA